MEDAEMSKERPEPVSLQFYDDVAPLLTELGRAMCVALDQGHAVLCAVSDTTRLLLEEQLTRRGIDVSDARTRGQYVFLEAVDVLSEITRKGRPDRTRFADTVGCEVESLVNEYPGVWMYGELAAIMWMQGHEAGAIEIDRLWASLAETSPVVLCAAFGVEALSWPIVAKALQAEIVEHIRALAKGSPIGLAIHHGPTGE
jgi:hypothetical protein